jgi:hypothetical protein
MATRLLRFGSVLRRLYPGKEPRLVLARRAIGRVAEHAAARDGATAESVLARVVLVHHRPFTDEQKLEMRLALERDMPGRGDA